MDIRKGSIVARKSYNKDVIFVVEQIIKTNKGESIAILKGLTIRIKADAPLSDLEIIEKKIVDNCIKKIDDEIEHRIGKCLSKGKKKFSVFQRETKDKNLSNKGIEYTGKILHLDGDRRYTDKSIRYYKQLGLNAIVKNVPENKQATVVTNLLQRYKPDILVITGHDSMIKNGSDYNNIYNYRNSRHFIETVKQARKWGENSEKLVIFAGACQSYFEAIMLAGADFASSPR